MNMRMILIYITTPDLQTARAIGNTLVQERLAACANIIDGMESFYWWQGKVERTKESICLCKSSEGSFAAIEKRVKDLHPYEVPCIVALPISHGHEPFMQWIAAETDQKRSSS